MKKIPFNKPAIVGKELFYIAQAVISGWIGGNGSFTKKCNLMLEKQSKSAKVMLTNSCTAALEMSAILIDIKPGDEVILSSFTFSSTATAFVLRGAVPIFVDIRSDTFNIDETKIEEAITDKTKAIIVMHYAGVSCEMDIIMQLAKKHSLYLIEDAAQGILSTYKEKQLGSFGDFGTYSFHETKNCTSGEGGALLINNTKFIERAEIILEKGTNRTQFFQGLVDKYTWVDIGSSYLPSDIIAAFLFAQLEQIKNIIDSRLNIWNKYFDKLTPLADENIFRLPVVPINCKHNGHVFHLLMQSEKERNNLLQFLKINGISAVFHYIPLHSSPMGKKLNSDKQELPMTDDVSGRILRLPLYYKMKSSDQDYVISKVNEWFYA